MLWVFSSVEFILRNISVIVYRSSCVAHWCSSCWPCDTSAFGDSFICVKLVSLACSQAGFVSKSVEFSMGCTIDFPLRFESSVSDVWLVRLCERYVLKNVKSKNYACVSNFTEICRCLKAWWSWRVWVWAVTPLAMVHNIERFSVIVTGGWSPWNDSCHITSRSLMRLSVLEVVEW